MNTSLTDAIRARVAREVAASLEPHVEMLRSLMGAIAAAHSTTEDRQDVARAGLAEAAPARATQVPDARRRCGHRRSRGAAYTRSPGDPAASQLAEHPGAREEREKPSHPAQHARSVQTSTTGATVAVARTGAVSPASPAPRPSISSATAAEVVEQATSAAAPASAPPSPAATSSAAADTRGFHIDQAVRIRRPDGFAEATVVQIDPSTGLLELELIEEGRYVKLPAEKVIAAAA